MKVNAPERLYLSKTIYSTYLYQVPDPDDETAVEYIRKDAFIEKVNKFFEDYFTEENCKFGISEWTEVKSGFESLDSLKRAFKNYMEG